MHYVYLLAMNNSKIYTGRTDNLKRRLMEHTKNQVTSTKNRKPKLIYYEAYFNKFDAVQRELFLKTGDGRVSIRKQLKGYLNKAPSSNG